MQLFDVTSYFGCGSLSLSLLLYRVQLSVTVLSLVLYSGEEREDHV